MLPDYERTKKLLQFFHELMTSEQDFRCQVLESMKHIFGYENMTFWLAEKKELYAPLTLQVPDKVMYEYLNYWKHDPFHPQNLNVVAARKNVLSLNAVTTEQYYEKNPYYLDILRPYHFKHKVVLLYKVNHKIIGASSILRTEKEHEFTFRDFETFNYIAQCIGAPLSQYLQRKDVEAERAFFRAAADDSPIGLVLFDEFFHINYYNKKALAYCEEWEKYGKRENSLRLLLQSLTLSKSDIWRGGFVQQLISPMGNSYKIEVRPLLKPRKKQWQCSLFPSGGIQELSSSVLLQQECITSREYEVAALVCHGLNNKEIANQLFISLATVKTHIQSLFQKLQVGSRTQLLLAMKYKNK